MCIFMHFFSWKRIFSCVMLFLTVHVSLAIKVCNFKNELGCLWKTKCCSYPNEIRVGGPRMPAKIVWWTSLSFVLALPSLHLSIISHLMLWVAINYLNDEWLSQAQRIIQYFSQRMVTLSQGQCHATLIMLLMRLSTTDYSCCKSQKL